jgi:hypothetical protein
VDNATEVGDVPGAGRTSTSFYSGAIDMNIENVTTIYHPPLL